MPIAYLAIKKQAALKGQQLEGTDQATLEAAYIDTDFPASLDGSEVPAHAYKDLILMIEKELAHIIGSSASHPYRTFLYCQTANLSDLAQTPSVDSDGYEIVGVFDSCVDSSNSKPLTYQPIQIIADINDGGNTFFDKSQFYYYNLMGNTIRHTRTNAYLTGCSWDYTTQSAAYDANGNSPLPEMLANTWVAGVLANLPQIGWTDAAGVSPYYGNVYDAGKQMLMAMGENVPLASTNRVTN